jgi:hypothetical protein
MLTSDLVALGSASQGHAPLAHDEATYRNLAAMPDQHQFYLRFNEVFTGEPTWEDIEMEWGLRE